MQSTGWVPRFLYTGNSIILFHSVPMLDAGWLGQEGGFNFELAGYPTMEPFGI